MPWPTPQDYQEAVQSPTICFSDPDLKDGAVEEDRLGLPRPISGGFAVVYKVRSGGRTWAVRCFQSQISDQAERYAAVSQHLQAAHLPYTVGFEYLKDGIRVRGQWHPILKMEWVEGPSLVEFVQGHLSNPEALRLLAARWLTMAQRLRDSSLAHGDLQHGNVLVVGGDLRLIDYDGVFVPSLAGRKSNENGHRNYQHPSRTARDYGPFLDNFSHWVIYVSLVVLSVDPSLWGTLKAGDECLLFRQVDYERPTASTGLALLERHSDTRLRALGCLLRDLWGLPLQQVPPVGEDLPRVASGMSVLPTHSTAAGVGGWWQDHLPTSPEATVETAEDPFTPKRDARWLTDLSAPAPTPLSFRTDPTLPRLALAAAFAAGLATPALRHVGADLVVEPLVAAAYGLLPYSLYRRDPIFSARDACAERRKASASRMEVLRAEWDAHIRERECLEESQRQKQAPVVERRLQLERQAQVRRQQVEDALTQELKAISRTTAAQVAAAERRIVDLRERRFQTSREYQQEEARLRLQADAALAVLEGGLQAAEQEWKRAEETAKNQRNKLEVERAAELRQLRDTANAEIARRNAEIRRLTATMNEEESELRRQRDLLQARVRNERANALRLRDRRTASALRDLEEIQQALESEDAEYEIDASRLQAEIDGLRVQEQRDIQAALPLAQQEYKNEFLTNKSIALAPIPGITPAHVRNLRARGYVTAGDVDSGVAAVTGIGIQKASFILDWRDQQERMAQRTLLNSLPKEALEKITNTYRERRRVLVGRLHGLTERHRQGRAAMGEQLAFRESIVVVEMDAASRAHVETLAEIDAYFQSHTAEFGRKEARIGEEHARQVDVLQTEIAALRATYSDGNSAKYRQAEEEITRREATAQSTYEQRRQELAVQIAGKGVELHKSLADIAQRSTYSERSLTEEEGNEEVERQRTVQLGADAEAAARRYAKERLDELEEQVSPDRASLLHQEAQIGAGFAEAQQRWQLEDQRLRGMIRSTVDEASQSEREWARFGDLSYRRFVQTLIFFPKTH